MRQFIIGENDCGQRVDKFLAKSLPELPKGMVYKGIRTKNIKVNRKRCKPEQMLELGDVLDVYVQLPGEPIPPKPISLEFLYASSDLDILFENDAMILMHKPVGLMVHSDFRQDADNLVNRMLKYLYEKGTYIPQEEQSFIPALCNRLDRNTSGIVLGAKTAAALRELNRMIRDNELHKSYYCITTQVPKEPHAVLKAWHKKSETHNTVTVQNTQAEGFREIITEYNVLQTKGNLALLEVHLITGRTHQIRAHLSHIGCPILGDKKYGNIAVNKRMNEHIQCLSAVRLQFPQTVDASLGQAENLIVYDRLPDFVKKYFPEFTRG